MSTSAVRGHARRAGLVLGGVGLVIDGALKGHRRGFNGPSGLSD